MGEAGNGTVISPAEPETEDPRSLPKIKQGKDGAPMVLVPAGTFTMGAPDEIGDKDEHPQHDVHLKDFYMDQYEVTVERYQRFLNENNRAEPKYWDQVVLSRDGQKPVVGIAWHDARDYCQWAGKRLPTEAEWEKAARGTDHRTYPWGNDAPNSSIAHFGKVYEPEKTYEEKLKEVGSFDHGQSPYGVYDMVGNVWEWVEDWYGKDYYQKSPGKNPLGPSSGEMKVIRGGSWYSDQRFLRSTLRGWFLPTSRIASYGGRCAKDVR